MRNLCYICSFGITATYALSRLFTLGSTGGLFGYFIRTELVSESFNCLLLYCNFTANRALFTLSFTLLCASWSSSFYRHFCVRNPCYTLSFCIRTSATLRSFFTLSRTSRILCNFILSEVVPKSFNCLLLYCNFTANRALLALGFTLLCASSHLSFYGNFAVVFFLRNFLCNII